MKNFFLSLLGSISFALHVMATPPNHGIFVTAYPQAYERIKEIQSTLKDGKLYYLTPQGAVNPFEENTKNFPPTFSQKTIQDFIASQAASPENREKHHQQYAKVCTITSNRRPDLKGQKGVFAKTEIPAHTLLYVYTGPWLLSTKNLRNWLLDNIQNFKAQSKKEKGVTKELNRYLFAQNIPPRHSQPHEASGNSGGSFGNSSQDEFLVQSPYGEPLSPAPLMNSESNSSTEVANIQGLVFITKQHLPICLFWSTQIIQTNEELLWDYASALLAYNELTPNAFAAADAHYTKLMRATPPSSTVYDFYMNPLQRENSEPQNPTDKSGGAI